LDNDGKILIGLKSEGSFGILTLGIGTTRAYFHLLGKIDFVRQLFIKKVRNGRMTGDSIWTNFIEIPSVPTEFE
jgi:hypothetical protein